jgi:hypothetical protein
MQILKEKSYDPAMDRTSTWFLFMFLQHNSVFKKYVNDQHRKNGR